MRRLNGSLQREIQCRRGHTHCQPYGRPWSATAPRQDPAMTRNLGSQQRQNLSTDPARVSPASHQALDLSWRNVQCLRDLLDIHGTHRRQNSKAKRHATFFFIGWREAGAAVTREATTLWKDPCVSQTNFRGVRTEKYGCIFSPSHLSSRTRLPAWPSPRRRGRADTPCTRSRRAACPSPCAEPPIA